MFNLIDLPYSRNALSPAISGNTLDFHYGKHHKTYVDNLNKLLEGSELEDETLENVILKTVGDSGKAGIFNNAAQSWNHAFYWRCMKPKGGGPAAGKISDMIQSTWETYDKFLDEIRHAGLTQFGSGWVWLVLENSQLKIIKTSNADTPIAHGLKSLLTIDVWEHAYYLDYQNRRGDYLNAFMENLVNWDFINSLLD